MGKKRVVLGGRLLIVCEGAKTEPSYLKYWAEKAIDAGHWAEIEILPRTQEDNTVKSARLKPHKKIVVENSFKEFLDEIYDETQATEKYNLYKSQPLRYVAEAFERKEDKGYDSCWAIFDRDGGKTKDYKEAFDFAKQNNVNIAFSARSFEVWLLAHFENLDKIPLTLTKTACKGLKAGKNTGQEAGCSLPTPEYPTQDCKGSICLVGYLRKYLSDFEKHLYKDKDLSKYQKMMQTFGKNFSNACKRAEDLRNSIITRAGSPLPIWQQPAHYTDVDRLLKEMLNL